ncbi:MAG: sulfate adenylyltransferase [Betaproteobacteria bacterium]|nr:sulfate adenylyltransferase [Betaproteobacteria bacterium]
MRTHTGLLRFITAGSVDDGKSTLIGRMLYDSKSLLSDQVSALEASSRKRGSSEIDLSLLTDGLLAEREQGITIDVAYRYFSTAKRKFIIGDSPGHVQYTRNMVTAASTADVAVLLVNARDGLQPQTRRHAFLARWIGIPRIVLAVNKMDLVDWSRARFEVIDSEFQAFASSLGFKGVLSMPMSALLGDMIVGRGESLGWYQGPALLEYLESVPARHDEASESLRFPVQRVVRARRDNVQKGSWFTEDEFRGYQGTVASGRLRVGDTIVSLPSGAQAKIEEIVTAGGQLDEAPADRAVTVRLDREIDVSRGDMFVSAEGKPKVSQEIEADVCWFDAQPILISQPYLIKQGVNSVRAKFVGLEHRIDVETLKTIPNPQTLEMNDIARVKLKTLKPLVFDLYEENRVTGAFVVIDERSNHTVGAGTIR